ncbi:MAG: thioredoxin domain-containing protein [Gemmatimonadales bacterium]
MAQGQKSFYYLLGGIAAVGVAVVGYRVFGGKTVSIPANVVVSSADTSGFRGYILGSDTAPVEVTEYADFECPGCANFEAVSWPDVKARLIETGKIRYRYRDTPLPVHPNSRLVAHAAACANDQGKFWEMKDHIFATQTERFGKTNPLSLLKAAAAAAGVNTDTWQTCMESAKYAGRIEASSQESAKVGVGSTPTFLIAGRLYEGMSGDEMVRIVDSIVAAKATAPATPPKP